LLPPPIGSVNDLALSLLDFCRNLPSFELVPEFGVVLEDEVEVGVDDDDEDDDIPAPPGTGVDADGWSLLFEDLFDMCMWKEKKRATTGASLYYAMRFRTCDLIIPASVILLRIRSTSSPSIDTSTYVMYHS
jgi:hypothetical protein